MDSSCHIVHGLPISWEEVKCLILKYVSGSRIHECGDLHIPLFYDGKEYSDAPEFPFRIEGWPYDITQYNGSYVDYPNNSSYNQFFIELKSCYIADTIMEKNRGVNSNRREWSGACKLADLLQAPKPEEKEAFMTFTKTLNIAGNFDTYVAIGG